MTVDVVRPTEQQRHALDLFKAGESMAIEAGAGCGKSSTLWMMARETDRIGRYLAFNRSLVQEAAGKAPMNVEASTIHSAAMRGYGRAYAHRLDTPRMPSWKLARLLDVGALHVTIDADRTKVLQPGYLASLVMRTIARFCQSAEAVPGPHHVPLLPALDPHGSRVDGPDRWRNNDLLRAELASAVERAWVDISDPAGRLPFTHGHYLKLWERNDPRLPGDFVLVDEAQDIAPVMRSIVDQQTDKQVVWVGDSQQEIYGWTGAINALAQVDVEHRAFLSRSFRFGHAIAEVANAILGELDAELRLQGTGSIDSRVGPVPLPDAVLCRSNSASVAAVLAFQRAGRRPHLIGGGEEVVRFAIAAGKLQAGEQTNHPDLACFNTWGEVREYVEQDPQGDELALMVKLLDEYGVQIVLDALDGMIAESAADVIVSTAHKSKGREWSQVRLAADYVDPERLGEPGPEWRLLYVAATRAQHALDLRMCEPLDELVNGRSGSTVDAAGSVF